MPTPPPPQDERPRDRREGRRNDGQGDRPDRPDRERPDRERPDRDRVPRGLLAVTGILLALLVLLALASRDELGRRTGQRPLELNEFERLLRKNEVEEVLFKDLTAIVTLRPGDLRGERQALQHTLNFVSPEAIKDEIALIRSLSQEDQLAPIETRVVQEPGNPLLAQLLTWFIPSLFMIGLLYFLLFRQMRGPGSPGSLINFGKSRHRVAGDKSEVTLDDVAGIDEARQDIEEIIEFLKNPHKFSRLGGRIPKGVLLVGPPGTGKTLLAKATAGEAGVPFYSVSGSDFVEMFVGVGASRVRDLFEKAKENSPCIVFLDEVDAVGRRRGSGLGGGHDEREQTLNQILVEMDGFDTDRGIIVMAATNRSDILDPALLRPGRFDRHISIALPDVAGREKILRVHARDKKMALDVDMRTLARATATFSGAELEALLNEAALMAAMADRDSITMHDLEEARDKVRWGRQRRSQKLVEAELRATAYHEAGHAIVAALLEGCDPLHKVTIVPRGPALGLTMSLPENDVLNLSRQQLLARIAFCYGGRIGEAHFTHDISTGASNDLEQATSMARRMVGDWGMSDKLGHLKYPLAPDRETTFLGRDLGTQQPISEATLRAIDEEVRRICDEQYARAQDLIAKHLDGLTRIAEALLQHETLSGQEVGDLLHGRTIRANAAAAGPPTPAGDGAGQGVSPAALSSPGHMEDPGDGTVAPRGAGGEPSAAVHAPEEPSA